jgi:hypothetical protein
MKLTTMARMGLALAAFVATSPLMTQGAMAQDNPQAPIPVFWADTSRSPPPRVRTVLGPVSDHLCRRPWDTAATDAEALAPIEAKARELGANALINVRFDRRRADLKSRCWQSVSVTASAVLLQPQTTAEAK